MMSEEAVVSRGPKSRVAPEEDVALVALGGSEGHAGEVVLTQQSLPACTSPMPTAPSSPTAPTVLMQPVPQCDES